MTGGRALSSKLQIPVPPPKTLERPRLYARLGEALGKRLTLVAADAGFGKSTLLASYLQATRVPAVWCRLDAEDSDPARFAGFLLQGLGTHAPRRALQAARKNLTLVTDWLVAAQLISAVLRRVRRELLIVLDDFHLLAAPTVREGITRLVEDLPAGIHLTMLTRAEPDLPLGRWRTLGFVAEIAADDLRFTTPELRELLVGLHGLPLSDASVHLVAAKTEGWPAGIVLALHAAVTQGPQMATQALAEVSGSSREIYDYLAQEAYARQPPGVRQFLLATALLSRFDAGLADAVVGAAGSRTIIDHLERSHLFVVSLDRERRWYRYHHLFQEFLQRVGGELDPKGQRAIHLRAARAWERLGEAEEALHHFIAAGQPAQAARLLAAAGLDLWARGRFALLRRWLAAVPLDLWPRFPRLYLLRANCEIAAGEDRAAMYTLADGSLHLRSVGDWEAESEAIRILGHLCVWEGERGRLRQVAADTAARVGEFPPAGRARILEVIARDAVVSGEFARAEETYREAIATAQASGNPTADLTPKRYLAALLADVGRFNEATALSEEILARYRHLGWVHEEAHQHVEAAAALVAAGRLDEADHHLAAAGVLEPQVPCRVLEGNLRIARSQAAARRGLRAAAVSLLREALVPGEPSSRHLIDRLPARIELSQVLSESEPEEARRLAIQAVEEAPRLGLLWEGQAQLAAGVVDRSAHRCRQAAALFRRLNVPHWTALALLHAAALARGEDLPPLRQEAAEALRALPAEAWGFVTARAGPALLAPYQDDPQVGDHVRRSLAAAADAIPVMTLRCLGPFELRRGDIAIPPAAWPRSAPRRLLQYLALQDRPVHREEIMDSLWPDLEPRRAANQLRVALSQLRRILEPQRPAGRPSVLLATVGPAVALVRERWDLDLDRFRHAVARASSLQGEGRRAVLLEAVEVYRGDLFADSPYEEWVAPHRDRLARQYLEVLTGLAEMDEAAGEWERAAGRWSAVLARQPDAEHAHRGLMRCYLAAGRGPDALRAYERCRAALADLGVSPSPETLLLHQQIIAASR